MYLLHRQVGQDDEVAHPVGRRETQGEERPGREVPQQAVDVRACAARRQEGFPREKLEVREPRPRRPSVHTRSHGPTRPRGRCPRARTHTQVVPPVHPNPAGVRFLPRVHPVYAHVAHLTFGLGSRAPSTRVLPPPCVPVPPAPPGESGLRGRLLGRHVSTSDPRGSLGPTTHPPAPHP